MKIIHTGDLHLDSPLTTHLPLEQARKRKQELLIAFEKVVDYANNNDIHVIIIAGDLFDETRSTKRTRDYLLELMGKNEQIDFIYVLGNHDEKSLDPNQNQIPRNLFIGNNSWNSCIYDGVTVNYINFNPKSKENLYKNLNLDASKKNIVVLHGEVTNTEKADDTDKIKLNELKGKNIDYLALGHIHLHSSSVLDERGIYVYCGCLEGRGFDEEGPKGFYVIDTDDIKKPQFQISSKRTIHKIEVDIDDCDKWIDYEEKVGKRIQNISNEDYVKIIITGHYSKKLLKNVDHLNETLNDKFFCAQVQDLSELKINPADYQNTTSFKGRFMQMVQETNKYSPEDKNKIIDFGIRALMGEDL